MSARQLSLVLDVAPTWAPVAAPPRADQTIPGGPVSDPVERRVSRIVRLADGATWSGCGEWLARYMPRQGGLSARWLVSRHERGTFVCCGLTDSATWSDR